MSEAPPHLESQVRVSKLLGVGFALSLVGTGGLSSLAALVIGVRAVVLIRRARGGVVGKWLAWWCVVAGAVGTALLLPHVIQLFAQALKQ